VRQVFNKELAFWALAASALSIGNSLLASILTIDAPLLFFWCLALYLYFRLLFPDGAPRWQDSILLALALGFGHLSKQIMLAFLPLMFVGTCFVRRDLLRKPHLYVASLLSLLFLLPPLLWNLSHHWLTVTHTRHHFEGEEFQLGEVAGRYAALGGVTALLLTPVLFALMAGATWSMRRWARQPAPVRMLFFFGGAALVGIAVLALRQDINPNWPAVFYPAAIAQTAWWCLKGDAPKRAEWFRRSIALAAAMTLGLMILLPFIDHLGIPAQRRGWRGYPELAAEIEKDLRSPPRGSDHSTPPAVPVVVQGHRFTCSQIAYRLRLSAEVYLWPVPGMVTSQYDLWPGPRRSDALLVIERSKKYATGNPSDSLAASYPEITFLRELSLHPSRDYPRFKIYRASGALAWPASVQEK